MKLKYRDATLIMQLARTANAFASAIEADDPKGSARMNGWTPEKLRAAAIQGFGLASWVTSELDWERGRVGQNDRNRSF